VQADVGSGQPGDHDGDTERHVGRDEIRGDEAADQEQDLGPGRLLLGEAPGFFGYFRSWIPAAPWPILIILIPVEILKYVVFQPFTLGVRLFGNMFAGHLLLAIFMLSTWYLASLSVGLLYAAGSLFMVFFVFVLELLVDLLQAFIFTTLTATYIADSVEYQH